MLTKKKEVIERWEVKFFSIDYFELEYETNLILKYIEWIVNIEFVNVLIYYFVVLIFIKYLKSIFIWISNKVISLIT